MPPIWWRGWVSGLERKNCWTIAERAGHPSPHGLQHLLARAVCDIDGVRDDLRSSVTERLMTPGEQAVLVVAHALLAILAATTGDTDTSTGLIPIALAEIRRPRLAPRRHLQTLTHTITWSNWCRRHQYQARRAHYRRRGHPTPQPELRLSISG